MPWKPGQTGNPNGTPKRVKIWRDAIERAIKRRQCDDPLALDKLAEKLLKAVDRGDINAMKEFGDRVDGKVTQLIAGDADESAVAIRAIGWLKTASSESRTTQEHTSSHSMTESNDLPVSFAAEEPVKH